jgi:hypothetical protein
MQILKNSYHITLYYTLKVYIGQVLIANACNPSYSRSRYQEEHILKPAWANSSGDLISEIPITKRSGGVGPEFKPQYRKNNKLPPKIYFDIRWTHSLDLLLYRLLCLNYVLKFYILKKSNWEKLLCMYILKIYDKLLAQFNLFLMI